MADMPPVSRRRLVAFYGVMLAVPLLFFGVLELGLRYADYGGSLDLFVAAPAEAFDEPRWVTNPQVAQRYFPRPGYFPRPRYETFRQQKPANGYRIFVLGGSTAASWPYPANVSFSRILQQRLSDTFPDRAIEVVNTAISAVNSFTLVDFMDEVLAHEPDAILIYAGHNEFYGALGAASSQSVGQSRWLIHAYLALLRLKTVQLIRDGVNRVGQWLSAGEDERRYPTLMGRMVGQRSIPLGSDLYETAKANYRANLQQILALSREAGVPVLLSELVSNLRDQPPFVPLVDETATSAADYFSRARALDRAGRYDQARAAYAQARALDGLRFRAPDEFNDVIHSVAAEFAVPVVPMLARFEEASPQGLIGSSLMLEHLHPNVAGYFLMSEAFFEAMQQNAFVSPDWPEEIPPADYYRHRWPITGLDRALGEIRIINLTDHWPYPAKQAGQRTIATFEPRNEAEALAFQHFRQQISYVEAHLKMASHHLQRGEKPQAVREYMALLGASPDNINHYLLVVSKLLALGAFDQAQSLLLQSLQIKETGYANKWIGQIYLMQQRPHQAQPFLLRAYSLQPDDAQLLYSLGASHALTGALDAATETLNQLRRLEENSPRAAELARLISQAEPSSDGYLPPMPPPPPPMPPIPPRTKLH